MMDSAAADTSPNSGPPYSDDQTSSEQNFGHTMSRTPAKPPVKTPRPAPVPKFFPVLPLAPTTDGTNKSKSYADTPKPTPTKTNATTAQATTTRKIPTVRASQCTHMSMIRMYGPWQLCSMCGKAPSIGFVYACEQDLLNPQRNLPRAAAPKTTLSGQETASRPRKRLLKSRRRRSADFESLGFATRIVDSVKEGLYTSEQMDKLIAQKSRVNNLVEDELINVAIVRRRTAQNNASEQRERPASPKGPRAEGTDSCSTADGRSSAQGKPTALKPDRCGFKVCHACRPYCRDRSYDSIEGVLKGDFSFPKKWYPTTMPVHSVHIVRNIGLGQNQAPSTTGTNEYGDLADGPDILSPSLQPPTNDGVTALKERPSSYGFRTSLRNSLIAMLMEQYSSRQVDPPSLLAQQGHELAILHEDVSLAVDKLERECLADGEDDFDLGLWRRLAQQLLDQAAAIALPGGNDSKERLELAEEFEGNEEETGILAAVSGLDKIPEDLEEGVAGEDVGVVAGLKEEAVQPSASDLITSI